MTAVTAAAVRQLRLTMHVNGAQRTLVVEPRTTLLDALREGFGLTGAKAGCGSDCTGACTVLVDGEPVRSCSHFAVQAHGAAITTVEADDALLATLQDAMAAAGAIQCGFCAPGFIMLAAGALRREPAMDDAAIDSLVADNMCRCGNYDAITSAIRTARDGTAKARAAEAAPSVEAAQ